jgi:hypothetical protein
VQTLLSLFFFKYIYMLTHIDTPEYLDATHVEGGEPGRLRARARSIQLTLPTTTI